jgi:predicted homoserine dehydrogenase-like protein
VIVVDRALQKRQREGNPVRVAMVGAGFMGRGIALQILNWVPGLRLVAIANRHLAGARQAYEEAGVPPEAIETVETAAELQAALARGRAAVTENPLLLCQAEGIEAVIEVTGKVYADRAGVVITNADGDQPGVTMNLYRFVCGLGVKPVLCGNIKGLHDTTRNPTTQEGFARRWGQRPSMVTSFADGTKISFEQAIVANATGMRVARRGMFGPVVAAGTPLQAAVGAYPLEALLEGPGLVDYLVGAEPAPGVFVLGTHSHPRQQHYLDLYKLGSGPLYCFYTPYHLCHFEVPNTVARAALLDDATIAPQGGPCVDVVATAKVDLKAGQTLDGLGEYTTWWCLKAGCVTGCGPSKMFTLRRPKRPLSRA